MCEGVLDCILTCKSISIKYYTYIKLPLKQLEMRTFLVKAMDACFYWFSKQEKKCMENRAYAAQFRQSNAIALIVLLFMSVFFGAIPVFAEGHSVSSDNDSVDSPSIQELLLFYEMEEIVIANRQKTPVKKAPAIATVISAQEIRNMGARNISDILSRVPGIGVTIGTVPVMRAIEMRGIKTLFTERILVMIDGHKLNDNLTGSAFHHISAASVDNIERVEIIRGPGSALYGANAFLGIINIVTRNAATIAGVQGTAGGGSFGTQHYNLLLGHESKRLSAAGSFDYYNTDGPSYHIPKDAIGRAGNTKEWQEKMETSVNVSYEGLTLRGGYRKNSNGPYIGAASALNDESIVRYGNFGYFDVNYVLPISKKFETIAKFYGDFFLGNNYFELLPEGVPGYPDGMTGETESTRRMLGGELTVNYELSDHMLTGGFAYENSSIYDVGSKANFHPVTFAPLGSFQDISSWGSFIDESNVDIWAAYFQDVWTINDKMSLTVGVRHDHYSDLGGTTNPRAGFVWEFMKGSFLKLLYGSAFRAPSFAELHQKNNPSYVGNPGVKPETIDTYEAGIEHRFLGNYTLRLNYFYNDLKDLIVLTQKQSATDPVTTQNKGSAKIQGIEAELLFDFNNSNYGYVNYSFQHPEDGTTGERLPDVPSHKINAGLNLALWKYLNANIGFSWIGERPRAKGDSRDTLRAMTLVDLTLISRNMADRLEIRGSVYNLFAENYRDPSPYPVKVPGDFPANSRMFMCEIRYAF